MKILSLIVFLLSIFLLFSCEKKPEIQSQTQKNERTMIIPSFNGNNAFANLKVQTDFGPRNPNSAGHQQCLDYLSLEMKKLCDTLVLQKFTEKGYNETLHLTNIFGSFNTKAKKRILLTAHWDTRPRAEMDKNESLRSKPILGANDGASGVAVLLELARLMKQQAPEIGVDILFTDGEDYGDSEKDNGTRLYFLGAKYFAKTKPQNYVPDFGILLDMVGDRDLQIPMEQNSMKFAPQVVDLVWNTAEEIGVTQFIRVPGELVADDHLALTEAGIPTIDLIDFDYPYWHTTQDTPDKCSAESLEAVGKVLAAIIYSKL
ncbi:MAG: M28 family peptidase [Bacteroidetes bacterium]|nr:M28 family peptidase [Bacteroidota bacterium]